MAHADVHPVLASTTVAEDAREFTEDTRKFYERHRTEIGVGLLLFFSALLNRSLIRRELTRLRFSVEIIPEFDEGVDYFDNLVREGNSPD